MFNGNRLFEVCYQTKRSRRCRNKRDFDLCRCVLAFLILNGEIGRAIDENSHQSRDFVGIGSFLFAFPILCAQSAVVVPNRGFLSRFAFL